MLQEKKVEIDGVEYSVREQKLAIWMPILEEGNVSGLHRVEKLMRVSVFNGAEPLGDRVESFGFRDFQCLSSAVEEVYGLTGKNPGEA